MSKVWTIVGISGCTNSGKTILSLHLQKHFPGCIIVNQDKFFWPDHSKEHILIPELNHKNWDCLAAINWNAMMENLTQILTCEPTSNNCLLIVEGHLLFNYEPFEKLCHKKYFLKMNKEECFRRRCTRVYDPPDIPGYFEKCVWPMYLSNLEAIEKNCSDIMYLNGTDSLEVIHENVKLDLQEYFRWQSY